MLPCWAVITPVKIMFDFFIKEHREDKDVHYIWVHNYNSVLGRNYAGYTLAGRWADMEDFTQIVSYIETHKSRRD